MTDDKISTTVSGGQIQGVAGAGSVIIENFTIYNRVDDKPRVVDSKVDIIPPCPYPGLSYFGPSDTDLFFGRNAAIDGLVRAVAQQSLTALVGASGAGKSSVVLAGVAPRLHRTGKWRFSHFRIGSEIARDPFMAMARALVPLYVASNSDTERLKNTKELAADLRSGTLTLHDVFAECRSVNRGERVLLVADQFEELFTLVEDESVASHFIDVLITGFPKAPPGSSPEICLILTLRGDFYGRALRHRSFADALQDHVQNLGPMNRDELRQAILSPAENADVSYEPGLVDTIIDNVESKPGSLPLLQFALREMWHLQEKRTITRASHETVGGVQGSLARRAEAVFATLTNNGTDAELEDRFRRLFVRLVMLGGGQEDTRRVVDRQEIGEDLWSLAQRLADENNRLLVTNNLNSRETVELTHEALIQHWPKLLNWLDRDRSFQSWLRQIRLGVELWEAKSEDDAPLLRGSMLAEATKLMNLRHDDLSPSERKYIRASQVYDTRLQNERAFLRATMSSLGLSDWSDRDRVEAARLKRLHDFISSIPVPRFDGWQTMVSMFGETLGLEDQFVMKEMLAFESSPPDTNAFSQCEPMVPAPADQEFVVWASAGAREDAFGTAEGSFFGRFFAEALEGRAANAHGFVTIESAYEYVTMQIASALRDSSHSQRPVIFAQGVSSRQFPLTATLGNKIATKGKRNAILVASDRYYDEALRPFSGREIQMQRSAALLADLGGFQVMSLLGAQMTRANLAHHIMDLATNSKPEDSLLFYFSGHSRIPSDDPNSMQLFLVDSMPSQTLSTLSLRDLGNTFKKTNFGTAIMVLDTSYAASAFRYFH